jgi:hypothetical protein
MTGEFAQLFGFALIVVGGFLAIGGAVMIFVWQEKDENKRRNGSKRGSIGGARGSKARKARTAP